MIAPILTILFFAINGIYTKTQELQDIKNTHKFTTVSLHLTDLVYELQKERGLSAGFTGSGGKNFRTEMLNQRIFTDKKLNQFNQQLNIHSSSKEYWGLSNEFTVLKHKLSQLASVRNSIIRLKNGDTFKYYSSINAHAINIIQYLQVLTNDASLARMGDAFASLLLLQERAGQERGAMNSIFESRELDVNNLQEINTYITEQKSILNNYYTVASSKYKNLLKNNLSNPVVLEVNNLRSAAINKSKRNELLNELQIMIGYGGLIHNFKNYIIREKQWYAEDYSKTSIAFKQIINQYKKSPGISLQEINHLKTIETTFDQYHSMLNNAFKMKKQGQPVIEMDKLIKVDDTPAINAIKNLREDITSSDTSKWWEIATLRIELIKKVSDIIRSDMVFRNQQSLLARTQSFALYIIFTIASISLSLIIGLLLMRQLVDRLVKISANMRDMHKKNNFNKRLSVYGSDEIFDMANAFNSLIDERKQQEELLRRNQKMDALDQLVGGIAHDYNNMLGIILGYADLLKSKLDEQPTLSHYTQEIINAGERSSTLTRKLLNFCGNNTRDATSLNINDFLRDQKSMLEGILTARILLTLDLSKENWHAWLNSGDLGDTIINICINATHAIKGNGQLIIKTSNEKINTSDSQLPNLETGDYIVLSITDTGCGMNETTKEKIFDPFFSTKGDKGTGMGLSQVYGFVKRSNGEIKVHSKPDHGSQFVFYFPRHREINNNT